MKEKEKIILDIEENLPKIYRPVRKATEINQGKVNLLNLINASDLGKTDAVINDGYLNFFNKLSKTLQKHDDDWEKLSNLQIHFEYSQFRRILKAHGRHSKANGTTTKHYGSIFISQFLTFRINNSMATLSHHCQILSRQTFTKPKKPKANGVNLVSLMTLLFQNMTMKKRKENPPNSKR